MFSKFKLFNDETKFKYLDVIQKENLLDSIFGNKSFNFILSILVLIDIILISWVVIGVSPKIFQVISYYDLMVVLLLIPDFINRYNKAEDKRKFVLHNCVDVIGMVPLIIVGPQSLFSFSRYLRILGLLRILLLFKNELKRIYHFFHDTHLDSGIIAIILIIIGGTFIFYFIEHGVNPHIQNFSDALWFVFVSITTVGYGDITPVTTDGKIVTVGIIIAGIIFFGFLTATISSWLVKANEEKIETRKFDQLEELINKRHSEMKDEIQALRKLIKEQK